MPRQGVAFSLKIAKTLHQEQSDCQHIAIYQTEQFGNLMVLDGCIMLSDRDNFIYHEMMSHPVLYSHPNPKTVWINGGGDCGTLRDAAKHPNVDSIIQIEIGPAAALFSETFYRACLRCLDEQGILVQQS